MQIKLYEDFYNSITSFLDSTYIFRGGGGGGELSKRMSYSLNTQQVNLDLFLLR